MGQSSPQLGLGFLGLKGLICFLRVLAGLMAESMAQVSTWAQAIELEGRARFVGFFFGKEVAWGFGCRASSLVFLGRSGLRALDQKSLIL